MKTKICCLFFIVLIIMFVCSGCNDTSNIENQENVSDTINSSVPEIDLPPSNESDEWFSINAYRTPITVSPEEFDFNGYAVLVNNYAGDYYWDSYDDPDLVLNMPVRDIYAILSQGISDFNQGQVYYEQLNARYYVEYNSADALFLAGRENPQEFIRAYHSRNVVYVSGSGNRVLCQSPGDTAEYVTYEPGRRRLYEIFEADEMVHSLRTEHWRTRDFFHPNQLLSGYVYFDYGPSGDNVYFDWEKNASTVLPQLIDVVHPSNIHFRQGATGPDGTAYVMIDSDYKDPPQQVHLYILPDFQLLGSYTIGAEEDNYSSSNYVQLLATGEVAYDRAIYYDASKYYYATCLYNPETQQERIVGTYCFNRLFSPDGRYIAFTAPGINDRQVRDGQSAQDMPFGYYIHDFETGKTVFYETEGQYNQIVCWSRKDGIDALIQLER